MNSKSTSVETLNSKSTSVETLHTYPIIMGSKTQVSSKADASGCSQQFIDRSLQKELSLSRRTVVPSAGQTGYTFEWRLTAYIHPGMRREIAIAPKLVPELVDLIHALAVGVAPKDDLDRRNSDWLSFHTFVFGGLFATDKDVLKYLRFNHFVWTTVEKYLQEYNIQHVYPSSSG